MRVCGPLFSINKIDVSSGNEFNYIIFERRLDSYLKRKYGRYYGGLQLYQKNSDPQQFYVIAFYRNIPGVEKVSKLVGKEVEYLYNVRWGASVTRDSVFSFLDYTRIIPPQVI